MILGVNMLNSPIATAVLVVSNLYQFVLPMPPLFFSTLLWTVSIIALTVILWKSLQKNIWGIWIAIFILNLLALVDIFNLIHFVGESYLMQMQEIHLSFNQKRKAAGAYRILRFIHTKQNL